MRTLLFYQKCMVWMVVGIFSVQTMSPSVSAQTLAAEVMSTEAYVPFLARGMKLDAVDPFRFHFIIDTGDDRLNQDQTRAESEKLTKYFLACLAVPEKDLWVNLSPIEKDRITSSALLKSDLGRDLLQQDFLLKQLTASLLSPDGETGRMFWEQVYQRIYQKYGSTDIPVSAFHKVWIMPESAELYAHDDVVLIMNSRLKVLLEQDYLARASLQSSTLEQTDVGDVAQMIKDMIIPEIVRQVNESEQFAPLRQIYHTLILAKWYKSHLQISILNHVYSDQSKMSGINGADPALIGEIYENYLNAFRDGSQLQEEYDARKGEIIAKEYVSGGFGVDGSLQFSRSGLESAAARQAFIKSVHGDWAMMQFDVQAITNHPVSSSIRWAVLAVMLVFLTPQWSKAFDHKDIFLSPRIVHAPLNPMESYLEADGLALDSVPAVDVLKDIFSRYYQALEAVVKLDLENKIPDQSYRQQEQEMLEQIKRILNLPDKGEFKEEQFLSAVKSIQVSLREKGYYFFLRRHSGFEYRGIFFKRSVLEVLLLPIISRETKNAKIDDVDLTYSEVILGGNLISKPEYIPSTIELVNPGNEVFLMPEQYRAYIEFYYHEYVELRKNDFPPYRYEGALWLKQWQSDEDVKKMTKDEFMGYAMRRMTEYYRTHALQHIYDFQAIKGGLKFPVTFPDLSLEINTAAHMEIRALLRQMMDGVLPYQALMDFGNAYTFRAEFGDDSEYALGAEIAYKIFNEQLLELYGNKFLSKNNSLGPSAVKIRKEVFFYRGFVGFKGNYDFLTGGWEFMSPEEISKIARATYTKLYLLLKKGEKGDKDDAQLTPGGVDLDTSDMKYTIQGKDDIFFPVYSSSTIQRGRIAGFVPVNIQITPFADIQNIFSKP